MAMMRRGNNQKLSVACPPRVGGSGGRSRYCAGTDSSLSLSLSFSFSFLTSLPDVIEEGNCGGKESERSGAELDSTRFDSAGLNHGELLLHAAV